MITIAGTFDVTVARHTFDDYSGILEVECAGNFNMKIRSNDDRDVICFDINDKSHKPYAISYRTGNDGTPTCILTLYR